MQTRTGAREASRPLMFTAAMPNAEALMVVIAGSLRRP
jgi:hypothetical protein